MWSPTGLKKLAAKTADYTLVPEDLGTLFTNRGAAGAVTFTLPANANVQTGWWAKFAVIADQTVTIAAGTVDTLIGFNDATADSVAFSTLAEKVGAVVEVTYDGTGWVTEVHLAAETQTPTYAT